MIAPLATAVLAFIEGGVSFAIFLAATIGLLVVIAFLVTRDGSAASVYDRIGAGGLSRDSDYAPPAQAESPAAQAERESEIRQLLVARSERLVRQGREPLDVDAELARLLAAEPAEAGQRPARHAADPGLREEVRQLVVARNERLIRQGQEPLDVDAEVARTLEQLGP
ncbi:MAG TPA: hypothetical protein VGY13_00220 [Solirubrobacteraceae bacterium]|nr:hypothetical protein [Solirubrobacteraceae bacterium]